jgi:hypothetical protein
MDAVRNANRSRDWLRTRRAPPSTQQSSTATGFTSLVRLAHSRRTAGDICVISTSTERLWGVPCAGAASVPEAADGSTRSVFTTRSPRHGPSTYGISGHAEVDDISMADIDTPVRCAGSRPDHLDPYIPVQETNSNRRPGFGRAPGCSRMGLGLIHDEHQSSISAAASASCGRGALRTIPSTLR